MTRGLNRRDILRLGLGVTGLSVAGACRTPRGNRVTFFGWTPTQVKMQPILAEFSTQFPRINLEWTGYASSRYPEQMLAIFISGTPRVDALWMREEWMAAWIEAGYIQPIDGIGNIDKYKRLMIPGALQSATVGGKLYGLPYQTGWITFAVNKRMLNAAGFSAPPRSLDNLRTHLRAIKRANILSAPMTFPLQPNSNTNHFVAMVYASGGRMFDEHDDPLFDGTDPTALEILSRLVDLTNEGLLDRGSVGLLSAAADEVFRAGRSAMQPMEASSFADLADPTRSRVIGDVLMADIPSLDGDMRGTVSITRQFGLGRTAQDLYAAAQVIEFMSGQDTSGRYWVQEYLSVTAGTISAYPEVNDYSTVKAARERQFLGNVALATKHQALGSPLQGLMTTWFAEWYTFFQQQLQEAILGHVSPVGALKASATKARDLKKNA